MLLPLNPQPISGNVGITGTPNVAVTNTPSVTVSGTPNVAITNTPAVTISGTPTVNIGNEPIDVNMATIAVEDTTIAVASLTVDAVGRTSLVSGYNNQTGTILELAALTAAANDTDEDDVYAVSFYTRSSGGTLLATYYFKSTLQLNPNVQYTLPNAFGTDNNLYVHATRLSGADVATVYLSVVYRITPP